MSSENIEIGRCSGAGEGAENNLRRVLDDEALDELFADGLSTSKEVDGRDTGSG